LHQNKVGGWNSAYVSPPTYSVFPSLNTIVSRAAAAPGSVWRIGNEIERRDWDGGAQDEITPDLYAQAYHDIRAAIKAVDPTARFTIGSVIQPTPLRLQYLDRVWQSYQSRYGYSMGNDIDIWVVHVFPLREVSNSWGAEIPAGFDNNDADPTNDFDPTDGFLYGASTSTVVAEHLNLARFEEFVIALRTWMAAHGQRNKPLLITEYGVLYKTFGNITEQDVKDHLTGSFDLLFNATDSSIGYPRDNNRLVQGWVWYSLNDEAFNGNLMNPTSKALTGTGNTWKSYVQNPAKPLASQRQPNLRVMSLRADISAPKAPPNGTVNVTLRAEIVNDGNTRTSSSDQLAVSFWNGNPDLPASSQIGTTKLLSDLQGCGAYKTVSVVWPVAVGNYEWYVKVEPVSDEPTTADNVASRSISVEEGVPAADLAVEKAVTPTDTNLDVTYTITATNHGSDPVGEVMVIDQLPDELIYNSYNATIGEYDAATGIWNIGGLNSGAVEVLQIVVDVDPNQIGQVITNQVEIQSALREDLVTENNSASVSFQASEPIEPSPPILLYLPAIVKD
ncbi:MAG: DUF11 domain-containing protein, partial [Anaerolineae bacterium]|nr:DUF11 domain-containing protein [Anaerolineae bacterium]